MKRPGLWMFLLGVVGLAALVSNAPAQTKKDSLHAATQTNALGTVLAHQRQYCKTKNPAKYICADSGVTKSLIGGEGALILSAAPPTPVPTPPVDSLAEPVFDPTKSTMLYQENFEAYTFAALHPTCGGSAPVNAIIDHSWYYCTQFSTNGGPGVDNGVVVVPGHSGLGVQFHYGGVIQESHGVSLNAPTASNTGTATTVVQHWTRFVSDSGYPPITDTVVAAKIKWILLWHNDPGNTRIQFSLIDGGCPSGYGPAYVNWSVIDQRETTCDGRQPLGPTIGTAANGQWHRMTYLYRPNSCATCRDGRALMWLDGHLMVRVEQSAVGVTPAGGVRPWCLQDDVDSLIVGFGVSTLEWGGPLTNGTIPFTVTIDDVRWWKLN